MGFRDLKELLAGNETASGVTHRMKGWGVFAHSTSLAINLGCQLDWLLFN